MNTDIPTTEIPEQDDTPVNNTQDLQKLREELIRRMMQEKEIQDSMNRDGKFGGAAGSTPVRPISFWQTAPGFNMDWMLPADPQGSSMPTGAGAVSGMPGPYDMNPPDILRRGR